MSQTIKAVWTGRSMLSLDLEHNLCHTSVYHEISPKFKVPLVIYCEFTFGPPNTQPVSSPFEAIILVIHQKWTILSAVSISFIIIFRISSTQKLISTVFINGRNFGPWSILEIALREMFTQNAQIVKSFSGSQPFHNCPCGYNLLSSLCYAA